MTDAGPTPVSTTPLRAETTTGLRKRVEPAATQTSPPGAGSSRRRPAGRRRAARSPCTRPRPPRGPTSGLNVGRQSSSTVSASGRRCRAARERVAVPSGAPRCAPRPVRAADFAEAGPHQSPGSRSVPVEPGTARRDRCRAGWPPAGRGRADDLAVPPAQRTDPRRRRARARYGPVERDHVAARAGRDRGDGVERAVIEPVFAAGQPRHLDEVAGRELHRDRRRQRHLAAPARAAIGHRRRAVLERPREPRGGGVPRSSTSTRSRPSGIEPERVAGRRARVGRHGGRGAEDAGRRVGHRRQAERGECVGARRAVCRSAAAHPPARRGSAPRSRWARARDRRGRGPRPAGRARSNTSSHTSARPLGRERRDLVLVEVV